MLEPAHAIFQCRGILDDLAEALFVALRLDEREKFGGIRQATRQLVELGEGGFQSGALASEGLRLIRRVPDRRVAELVIQLFEALALRVVFKGTPSAPSGAP